METTKIELLKIYCIYCHATTFHILVKGERWECLGCRAK